jgi:hypothetical protein
LHQIFAVVSILYCTLHCSKLQDYNKLRAAHQARLARSSISFESSSLWKTFNFNPIANPNELSGLGLSNGIGLPRAQQRSFFSLTNNISGKLQNLHLKGLETVANSRSSDAQAQYEFLYKLLQTHPQVVVERVTHPMFRHFALDGRIAMLYLQALQQTQRFQQFSLDEIAQRLQEQQSNTAIHDYVEESRKMTKPQQVAGLMNLLGGGGAAGMGSMGAAMTGGGFQALQRGVDPKDPLHVQLHNPTSTRAALFSLAGRVLIAFVVVSALSAILDEKGVGRGLGMNNGSKHVQQAENATGVTFDDVKGVEEAKAELEEIVMVRIEFMNIFLSISFQFN